MEESPPPVPPKDYSNNYATSMSGSRPPSAPASGSKRKRETQDDTVYNECDGRIEVADQRGQGTPKRSRSSHAGVSDGDVSTDNTPMAQRGLRRKKGSRNLSNLNLRHKASLQALPQRQSSPSRESKFQEGSLSDKPSDKPPSMYTRFTRTDSGTLMMVDELMSDYHNGMPTPKDDKIEKTIQFEKDTRDERVVEINARQKKDGSSGIFKFGRSFSSGFNPISLWNKIWGEQREALIRENIAEAERKARLKAAAEARYAEMKNAGQLPGQHITFGQPHDSAVALESSARPVVDQYRDISFSSALRTSQDDGDARESSEIPESSSRPLRAVKSRLHLRKPSLQSLKYGLKRTKSEFSLGAAAAATESSSSASPTKPEFDNSALKSSVSRYDLKKQHKLTKRVSDLETKLQKARSELDQALVEASPAPRLNGKYQRFTPNSTIRKPKFVPGALPTLPSGQVLFPEELGFRGDEANIARLACETRPRKALDLSEAFDDIDGEDVVREIPAKPRERGGARSDERKNNEVNQEQGLSKIDPGNQNLEHSDGHDYIDRHNEANHGLPEHIDIGIDDMSSPLGQETSEPPKAVASKILDEKLRALDANVKLTKKSVRSKKRTTMHDDEKTFKPGGTTDDDEEWDKAIQKPKKKRKSTGRVETTSRNTRANIGPGRVESPEGKKSTASKVSPKNRKSSILVPVSPMQIQVDIALPAVDGSEDELVEQASARNSVASENKTLKPVFEEEEENGAVSTPKSTSMPADATTAARFGRHAVRSGSASPQKRSEPVTKEERMMSRAAVAAQRKRSSRSASPPPRSGCSAEVQIDELVTVVPGEDGAPKLPTGANGSFESLANAADVEILRNAEDLHKKPSFEWPEDVF
ncbi:hypothetical protein DOTSEDRAFT_41726 [Dothistroma septosporum NZE10]|uniref:Nuclear RNA binding protein n=1 Tax=Dothistroma septosporum (strain NZE10 / CBS 128990) TaxID=675120 RepID=N1PWD9_DOTSN|nr:hypothetical protein DOTSEDRAFT_41726 [Dothistroma septosporum NZE10]